MEKRMSEEEYQAALEEEKKAEQLAREMDQKPGHQGDPRPPLPPELEEKLGGDPEEARERIRKTIKENLEVFRDLNQRDDKEAKYYLKKYRERAKAYLEGLTTLLEEWEARAVKEEIGQVLEDHEYKAPSVTSMQTALDPVTSTLFKEILIPDEEKKIKEGWTVQEGKPKNSTRIDYYVQISYEGTEWENVTMPDMNMFDRAVLDAVGSIYIAGDDKYVAMSYETIYRVMTGKLGKSDHRAPKGLVEAIQETLRKFSVTVTAGKIGKNGDVVREIGGTLLPYRYLTNYDTINGRKVAKGGIVVLGMPFTFFIAMQDPKNIIVSSRDATLLDVPGLNNTVENIMLRYSYFIRVTRMHNRYERKIKQSDKLRTVTREYVYNDLGIENPDDWKKADLKKREKLIFNFWISKGFISGYEYKKVPSKGGGRPTEHGVIFEFEKPQKKKGIEAQEGTGENNS